MKKYPRTLKLLGLEKRLKHFVKLFAKGDEDGSGTIDLVEFLEMADLERTPFTKRAFKTMDADGSGALDFRELVFSVWNYCTLDARGLAMYTFDLYDIDASGLMDKPELIRIVTDVYGGKGGKALQVLSRKLELHATGRMNKHEFVAFAKQHSRLLVPSYEAQKYVRKNFGGVGFWKGMTTKRNKKKDPRFAASNWRELQAFLMESDMDARQRTRVAKKKEKAYQYA